MFPVDPAALLPFLIGVLLVEATPGPNMGYLAALSVSEGRRAGMKAVLGVTLGLSVYMIAAVIGVAQIVARLPLVYAILRWAGVAYLLFLAWQAWQEADETSPSASEDGFSAPFWRGFLANVLNPKAAVFYVSLLPTFISAERGQYWVQALIFGLLHIIISVLVHTTIVVGGAHAGGLLDDGVGKTRLRRIMALLIAAVAIWLAWETRQG